MVVISIKYMSSSIIIENQSLRSKWDYAFACTIAESDETLTVDGVTGSACEIVVVDRFIGFAALGTGDTWRSYCNWGGWAECIVEG
jgi:hypothetical protein